MNMKMWAMLGVITTVTSAALAKDPWTELPLDARQQAALGVRVMPVESASTLSILASAQVGLPPGREVVVAAPYAGTITRVDVGVGDNVTTSTALAWITSTHLSEARRQWRDAQLEVDQGRLTQRREQALLDEGLIPQARFDLTVNRVRQAEAALAARDADLRALGAVPGAALKEAQDFTAAVVRSTQAGNVIEAAVTVGQRLEAGTVMFRLADTRQLQLDLQLSVDKARHVRIGDTVTLAPRQAHAVIVGVSRSTDSHQMVRARARVTQPGNLAVGEVLPAQIQSRLPTTQGWRVPIQALVQHPTSPLVFVATEKGFRPTPVRILSSDDDRAVVEGALQTQSRVAISGVSSLRSLQQQEP
jgi:multidrug efflux pump subunit AcrA (membrane-fusion protein)